MTMTTEELLRQLKSKEIVIFGAGFVAEMFYRALELHGAEGSLCFCAVTRAGSGQRFHGRPVLSLSEADIREDMLVCLAVHESAEDSLRETLRPYEAQTVRIYPHLFELLYGAPVRYEAALPLAALLARQDREEYWLVVRYAAVRDYLAGGRDYPDRAAPSFADGGAGLVRRGRGLSERPPGADRRSRTGDRRAAPNRLRGLPADRNDPRAGLPGLPGL